jgi:hypothetical protein
MLFLTVFWRRSKSGTKQFSDVGIRCQRVSATVGREGARVFAKQPQRRPQLQRTFSRFPGGSPGSGLLLLRAAIGCAFIALAAAYLVDWHDLRTATVAVCVVEMVSGLLLVAGYLTPLAAVSAALSCVCSLAWLQAPLPNFFESKSATALAMAVVASLVCLGPGAFSLDSHLFGRREIIIPDASGQQKV